MNGAQGFRDEPQLAPMVWRFDPTSGAVGPIADGFVKPNGVVFSPDYRCVLRRCTWVCMRACMVAGAWRRERRETRGWRDPH